MPKVNSLNVCRTLGYLKIMEFIKMKPETKDTGGKKKYRNFQGTKTLCIGWFVYILRSSSLDRMMTSWQQNSADSTAHEKSYPPI